MRACEIAQHARFQNLECRTENRLSVCNQIFRIFRLIPSPSICLNLLSLYTGWWNETAYPNIKRIPALNTGGPYLPSSKGRNSDIAILADSFHASDKKPYYRFANDTAVDPVHRGRANALFFDGHVDARALYELKTRSGFQNYYNRLTGTITSM